MIYRIKINDLADKTVALIEVEKALFKETLNAVLSSIEYVEPRRIYIEFVSCE